MVDRRRELLELADRALEHLSSVNCDLREQGPERWRGRCSLCGDDTLELRVDLNEDRLFLGCWHATCETTMILESIGLTWDDLRLDQAAAGGELVRRSFDTIKFAPVRFLVPDRVPVGGVTVLAGDPKTGKSTWAALIAAGTTTGAYGDPAVVAFVNAEDSAKSVTGPRLKAAGARLELVEELLVNVEGAERVITLPEDVEKLEAFVVETKARLIVLDPLFEFLTERAEANRDHSVRRALVSLRMMAERHGVAVLACMHLNKDEQKGALYRVGGTIGFVALSRSLLLFAKDPDDPDGAYGNLRVLAHGASNWARLSPTLRYRVEEQSWEEDDKLVTTTKLVFEGECELEAEDLIGKRPKSTKTERAATAIVGTLDSGPRLSREVKAEVMEIVRCGLDTVDRAATDLRVRGVLGSSGNGPATTWCLLNKPPDPQSSKSGGGSNEPPIYKGTPFQPPPDQGDQGSGGSDQAVWNGSGGEDDRERAKEAFRRARERA